MLYPQLVSCIEDRVSLDLSKLIDKIKSPTEITMKLLFTIPKSTEQLDR